MFDRAESPEATLRALSNDRAVACACSLFQLNFFVLLIVVVGEVDKIKTLLACDD